MKISSRGIYYVVAVITTGVAVLAGVNLAIGQTAITSQPQNFQAAGESACTINISWTAQQADSYQVHYAANATSLFGNYQTLNLTNANVTTQNGVSSYAINNLATSTPYVFAIQAQANGMEPSAWSSQASGKTMPLPTPGTPNFTTVQGGSGNQQMQLSLAWNGQAPATPYTGVFVIKEATSTNGSFSPSAFNTIEPSLLSSRTFYSTGGTLDPSYVYAFMVQSNVTSSGCAPAVSSTSPFSNAIMVPTVPKNLTASYVYNPNNPPVNLSWSASILPGSGNNYYEIWRGSSATNLQPLASTTATTYSDYKIISNSQYYYAIRACNANSTTQQIGCSDLSNTEPISVTDAPQQLVANISGFSQTSPATAKILLTWKNTFTSAETANYYVQRDSGNGFQTIGNPIPAGSVQNAPVYFNDAVTAGPTYSYRVYATFAGQTSTSSNVATIDTNVAPLSGFGWGGYTGNAGGGGPVGIGWIDFAPTGTSPGVYMTKATGALSGYAWSSNMGWLSFNASDVQNCPSGGNCAPTVNPSTGAVSGWARFNGTDRSQGAFTGWVSLGKNSQDGYSNVSYNSTSGNFNGYAWTDLGWISFNGTAADGSTYCVTTGSGCSQSGQAPVITSVTSTASTITVYWRNPTKYKHVQVQVSQPGQANMNDKSLYQIPQNHDFYDAAHVDVTSSTSSTIPNLVPGKSYGIFVRGFTQ